MPNKVIHLRMNEPDGVMPSDGARNLDDLAPASGAAPTSVSAWTGKGRQFLSASSQAFVAADLAGRDTLLTRDLTIQAIVAMNLTADKQVLISRGLNDGTPAQYHSFGIELEQQALWPGYVEARMFWQDSAGLLKVQPAGVWRHPGDGKFFLLTATRRWESTAKVVTRYYIGEELIAEVETADGDIAGGTTGSTSVGARQDSGAWEHFFNGIIDELLVADHEMSPEEVRHTWRRLAEFQPAGAEMFAGLTPKGLPWAKNPGNAVGKYVRHSGELVGLAVAGAEEIREMIMPDRAPLGIIERWERACGLTARPRDSLDVRRARVVAHLSSDEGFHLPSIKTSLSGLLGLDADDVEILEFSNVQTDAFAELDTDERWIAGDDGTWSIATGAAHVDLPAGANVQFDGTLGAHLRMPVDNGGDVEGLYVSAELVGYALSASSGVGIMLVCRRTNNALYFGVYNDAGTNKLVYRKIVAGVASANVVLATPAAAAYWLRLAPATNGVVGSFRFLWSTVGPDSGFAESDNVAIALTDFDWVGFGVFGDDDSTGDDIEADWDDFLVHAPKSSRPFNWYAYADPALSPNPDIIGARHLVSKIKPAHTNASAIQSLSVLAGDARDGLAGRGPLGGF
jgi:hypothetical protein